MNNITDNSNKHIFTELDSISEASDDDLNVRVEQD
jgi:hypothetical protein